MLFLTKFFTQSDIRLLIETTIAVESRREHSRLIVNGTIYSKGDITFCIYKESTESGEVNHTIKIDARSRSITVSRSGAVSMRQRFIPSQKTEGTYHTPYGSLPVTTLAKKIQFTWDDKQKKGTLLLAYDLWIQGNYTGFYTVKIHMEGV